MQLLKKKDVAEALNVTERTLHNWNHAGKLSFVRIGHVIRIDAAVLERFIAERKYKGRKEANV